MLALVGAVALGFRAGSGQPAVSGQPPEKAIPAKAGSAADAPKPAAGPGKEVALTGRVLGPDDKPFPGAKLLVVGKDDTLREVGTSRGDGRFAVPVPRPAILIARADGFGIGFFTANPFDAREVELRLVNDRPLHGRVVDTQGKPVAGVTVGVQELTTYETAALDSFVAASKRRTLFSLPQSAVRAGFYPGNGSVPWASTDAEGRFTLRGVGADRIVVLRFGGGGIAEFDFRVLNRDGVDHLNTYNALVIRPTLSAMVAQFADRILIHAPDQDIVAEPEMPIRGTVTAGDTGKGRAGAVVRLTRVGDDLLRNPPRATTDAAGRYAIHGAPKGKAYTLRVESDADAGYMSSVVHVADTPAYTPVAADVTVVKGVVVKGKVVDTSTGKGIPGQVMLDVLTNNPFLRLYPGFDDGVPQLPASTEDDGSFRAVTIPGPVILLAGPDAGRLADGWSARYRYRQRISDPKYPQYFPGNLPESYLSYRGRALFPNVWCKVLEIEAGKAVVEQDVVLEPATRLPVLLRDAAGQPLTGVLATGTPPRALYSHFPVTCKTDTCQVYDLEPGKPRLLVLFDPARTLAAAVTLKGDEKAPVTVTLGPTGTLKGRLVGADGEPLAGVTVNLNYQDRQAREVLADERFHQRDAGTDGSFVIESVLPGLAFDLRLTRNRKQVTSDAKLSALTVESGRTMDLGKLTGKIDVDGNTR
jgi:hypothetical protein